MTNREEMDRTAALGSLSEASEFLTNAMDRLKRGHSIGFFKDGDSADKAYEAIEEANKAVQRAFNERA